MNQTLRRRRRRQENRIKLIAALVITAIAITFIFNILLSNSSIQGDVDISNKGYITITVHSEDSLWSIAEAYMNSDFYTFDAYIAEVSKMNHIDGDKIYAGEQLLIPVVSDASMVGSIIE